MDVSERNDLIRRALRGRYDKENEKKLQKLLNERQLPLIPPKNDLEIRKAISFGSFGIVDVVRYQKRLYAHKRPWTDRAESHKHLLDEAIQLSDIPISHPNIQRVAFINLESLGFLMDYCDGGTLETLVNNSTSIYTFADVLNWSYQLADALNFLHSINIMHRDVKMQNILLKDNYQQLILTDYGTASQVRRVWLTRNIGTPITMAPEIIRGNIYNEHCDIYSWAIIFWQLIAKQFQPYDVQTMTRYDVLLKVWREKLRPPMLRNCPKILVALMYRSWHSDPNERPSLLCIKTILRLLLKFQPKCSSEVIDETKSSCTTDSKSLEKYFPYQPRMHIERSKNLYEEHSRKLKTIVDLQENISVLDERVETLYERNKDKRDHHQLLLDENQRLREQIQALRTAENT